MAHELTHALQRHLADPLNWPDGKFPPLLQLDQADPSLLPLALARPIGDSTNHMEVVAYIVGETVQYDLLQAELTALPPTDPLRSPVQDLMEAIENDLATYTGPDALNANRWMLKSRPGAFFYQWNYVTESLIPGNRIPSGGWEQSLRDIGFSDASIAHIQAIASQGTAQVVGPGEVGPLGDIRTPTPTPSPTPTGTPTPTASPTASITPTASATPTAASSPSPTPTPAATSRGQP